MRRIKSKYCKGDRVYYYDVNTGSMVESEVTGVTRRYGLVKKIDSLTGIKTLNTVTLEHNKVISERILKSYPNAVFIGKYYVMLPVLNTYYNLKSVDGGDNYTCGWCDDEYIQVDYLDAIDGVNADLSMRLLRYTVGGAKAIEEPVTLDFSENSCGIKAIYGANGSGKSSIIGSVGTLRDCITIPGYLHDANVQKYLLGEINKKVGEMYMRVEFEDSGLAHSYELTMRQCGGVLEYDTRGEYAYAAEFAKRLITTTQNVADPNRLYTLMKLL